MPGAWVRPNQLIVRMLIGDRGVKKGIEIGTFHGGTTAAVAEALPADGRIITVDLPGEAFSRTQAPTGFSDSQVSQDTCGHAAVPMGACPGYFPANCSLGAPPCDEVGQDHLGSDVS